MESSNWSNNGEINRELIINMNVFHHKEGNKSASITHKLENRISPTTSDSKLSVK